MLNHLCSIIISVIFVSIIVYSYHISLIWGGFWVPDVIIIRLFIEICNFWLLRMLHLLLACVLLVFFVVVFCMLHPHASFVAFPLISLDNFLFHFLMCLVCRDEISDLMRLIYMLLTLFVIQLYLGVSFSLTLLIAIMSLFFDLSLASFYMIRYS